MGMTTDGLSYWQAESEGIDLLDLTIGDFLDQQAAELPNQEAIVYSCYPEFGNALAIRWTYQDYREQANAAARGLMALGLRKGDHIAVWAINLPEWLPLMMGAAKAGLVLVTINPVLQAAEVAYILEQGDVQALFFMAKVRDHDCLATIRSLVTPGTTNGEVTSARLPLLRYVSLIGMPPPGVLKQQGWRPTLFREVVEGGMRVGDEARRERQGSISPHDPAMILYTSGTTGSPKGAVLTHYGMVNNARLGAHGFEASLFQHARCCIPLPFFHAFAISSMLTIISVGGTLHPLMAFDPVKTMQVIESEGCIELSCVPTMLLAMMRHPDFDTYRLSSLKYVVCAGAPVPVALMEQVKARIGADVLIPFGQTEASPGVTVTPLDASFELKSATVGVPFPHTEVKISNPAPGEVVPVGERGELCCRGYLVMAGYYKKPEKTAETIDAEGWLHTGDLATMNAQGYINIVGRLKEMVICGGENLFPVEIEEFLIRHPKVAEVQVVGVPDPFFGEELLAAVIKRAGEQLTEEELREYCKGRISHQKIPRYFQFVESYPMTGSGKVQKFVLREQAIKSLGLEDIAKIKTA